MRAEPAHDQYLVSHGRNGAVGAFLLEAPLALKRGTRVLVKTARGIEVGVVRGPASIRQARWLGSDASGVLVRTMTDEDDACLLARRSLEDAIFSAARTLVEADGLPLEVLDVELLFDGQLAILQFVGKESDTEKIVSSLEARYGLAIRCENLANPKEPHDEHPHCDKPDCGRDAGGCSTCSTGGGCSSCGAGKTDLREYFSHLRSQMEATQRIPLA